MTERERFPRQTHYALMSFWGHVMSLNRNMKQIGFRSMLGLADNDIIPFSPPPGADDEVEHTLSDYMIQGQAPPWKITKGSLPRCFSLIFNNKYVGSRQDGSCYLADKRATWENFFFISGVDLAILRSIILSRFRVPGEPDGVAPKLGLKHFDIIWNGQEYPLHVNCPLWERFDGRTLHLESRGGSLVLERWSPGDQKPQIWINPAGNIGNRALQYLAAEGIREQAPEAVIKNVHLEMWGIHAPAPRPEAAACAGTGAGQFSIDVKGLGDCLVRREVEAIAIDSFTFCIDHYPSREKCRQILPATIGTEHVKGFDKTQLVCNIRAGEILRGVHKDYIPLPVRYYQLLAEESGLELVFYGQIGDDPYSESLRRHFPHSRFVASQGEAIDFETIRRSKNIAVAISTFSWLAAWLSDAQRIYVPVGGMFNPVQHPGQTYLPADDPAYQFVLMPIVKTVSLFEKPDEFWNIQDKISKFLRFAKRAEIEEVLSRMTTWPVTKRVMAGPFDAKFYCSRYPDVAVDVLALKTTALDHYLRKGYRTSSILAFDEIFYGDAYPDAEADVALGRFRNLIHHFVCKGWRLGYRPHAKT